MTVMERSPPRTPIHSSSIPEIENYGLGGSISMVSRRSSSTTSSENMTLGNSNSTQTSMEEDKNFQMAGGDDEEGKRARRRMKNKISAQESRRRKKEYVDALELKMKQRDQEKRLLTEKVTELEERVRQLVDQLFHAKQNNRENNPTTITANEPFISQKTTDAGTQTGICLECYLQTPSKVLLSEKQIKNETEEDYPSNEVTNEKELDPSLCLNHETPIRTSPKPFTDHFHQDNNERLHPYRINRDHYGEIHKNRDQYRVEIQENRNKYREIHENRDQYREHFQENREHFQENREHVRYSSSLSYPPSENRRRSSMSYRESPDRNSASLMSRFSPVGNKVVSPDRAPNTYHIDRKPHQNSMVIPPQATFRRISNTSSSSLDKMVPYSKY